MLYVPLPVVIVSASGAGAMDVARIGMVLGLVNKYPTRKEVSRRVSTRHA